MALLILFLSVVVAVTSRTSRNVTCYFGTGPVPNNHWCFIFYGLCKGKCTNDTIWKAGGEPIFHFANCTHSDCHRARFPGEIESSKNADDAHYEGVACCCNNQSLCNNATNPKMNATQFLYDHYFPVCLNDTKWNNKTSDYSTHIQKHCLNESDQHWHNWNFNYWCYDKFEPSGKTRHERGCVDKGIQCKQSENCSKHQDTYVCCCKGQRCNAKISAYEFYQDLLPSTTTTNASTEPTRSTQTPTTSGELSSQPSSERSTTNTRTTTTTRPPSPSPTTTTQSSSTSPHHSSSTSSPSSDLTSLIIGLAVGGCLLLMLFTILICVYLCRRRRPKPGPIIIEPPPSESSDDHSLTATESIRTATLRSSQTSTLIQNQGYQPRSKAPRKIPSKHANKPIGMSPMKTQVRQEKPKVSFSKTRNEQFLLSTRGNTDQKGGKFNTRFKWTPQSRKTTQRSEPKEKDMISEDLKTIIDNDSPQYSSAHSTLFSTK